MSVLSKLLDQLTYFLDKMPKILRTRLSRQKPPKLNPLLLQHPSQNYRVQDRHVQEGYLKTWNRSYKNLRSLKDKMCCVSCLSLPSVLLFLYRFTDKVYWNEYIWYGRCGEVEKRQQHSKIYIDTHTFSVVVEFPPSCLPAEKELIALSDNDFIIIIWANQQ